jgi:hypothetical protein
MITAASAIYIAEVVTGNRGSEDWSIYPHTRKSPPARGGGARRTPVGRRILAQAFGRRPSLRVKNA